MLGTTRSGFYNGMERDLANHNEGLEQSVLEDVVRDDVVRDDVDDVVRDDIEMAVDIVN